MNVEPDNPDPKLANATSGASRETYVITGMDCSECALKIDRAVGKLHGVERVSTAFASSRMAVTYNPLAVSSDAIRNQVRDLGFGVHDSHGEATAHDAIAPPTRTLALVVALAFLLLGVALQHMGLKAGGIALFERGLFGASILVGGWPVFRATYGSLAAGLLGDINVLMSLAVVGAVALGKWDEGAVVFFLYGVGQWLEMFTMDRTRSSIRGLMALAPPTARLVGADSEIEVPSSKVEVGSLIRVRAGERVPLDGVVEDGHSAVDESTITGESLPVEKQNGSSVYAGTMNGNGVLQIRTTCDEADSTISRIVEMVQESQSRKAPTERLVDRMSRWYTPSVIALAIAVVPFVGLVLHRSWRVAVYEALVMLVASCPCALVISTPVAVVSALGNAARRGVLIKGGAALEAAGNVGCVAFDKTGTLTEGQPTVTMVMPAAGVDEGALVSLAAGLEAHSAHPLADAIRRYAAEQGIAPTPVLETHMVPGRGISGSANGSTFWVGSLASVEEAQGLTPSLADAARVMDAAGHTVLAISSDSGPLGLIGAADRPRAGARAAVNLLREQGISCFALLTGDSQRSAEAVALALGIEDVRGGLLPGNKRLAIEEMAGRGGVAMVGDGVNDAPALAAATVGIAMGAIGSDAAIEAADIALMGDDLGHVSEAIALSRRTVAVIRQNVWFALGIKAAFVIAVLAGVATLWMAVAADTGASVLVTLNAMRLMNGKSTKEAS